MKKQFYILMAALLTMHTYAHSQFVREYVPSPNANLSFECIAKAHSGNYFIAGLQDTSVYVAEVNSSGNIVREKLVGLGINSGSNFYRLNAMIVDSDFNIVIVGLINPAPHTLKAFLMKLSPALSVLLHVVYTNNNSAYEMAFTDIKDYKVNGTNDAYYVSGYSDDPSNQDAVLMRLNRSTGAILTQFNGQPLATSSRDFYGSLLLDISNSAGSPSSIFTTGGLSSGAVSTIRPWVNKHNISTLAFITGERYLKDVQSTQIGSLYNVGLVKDVPNNSLLYSWYGNPTTALGNHTAMGLARVNAGTLAPVWQKQYKFTTPIAVPAFPYSVLRKIETDASGYIAQGMWSDGLQDGGGEIFFIRTDKTGLPLWARQYKGVFNYQPINSCFLVDGANIFAIGYKVVSGVTRGVLIKTPLATGSMDTTCARVLTTVTADSTFAKADKVVTVNLAVTPATNYYPINCIVSTGTKPCDTCIAKALNCSPTFTLDGVLVGNNTTFAVTASAYSNGCNSRFVVSQVNPVAPYTDIPGTVATSTAWGTGTTTVFNGYNGTGTASGANPGVFVAGLIYRVRHIISGVNNCGISVIDTSWQLIFHLAGMKANPKSFIILDGGKGDINLNNYIINAAEQTNIDVTKANGGSLTYPNPANGFIMFNTTGLKQDNVVLKIVNGNGQTVNTENFKGKTLSTVATATWANGLYLYSFTSNGKVVSQGKFVVLH